MIGALQFGRIASLVVVPRVGPTLVVNPLAQVPGVNMSAPQIRMAWTVEKTLSLEPQRATVQLDNLGPITRDALIAAVTRPRETGTPGATLDSRTLVGTTVQLLAGHASLGPPIAVFRGQLTSARNIRVGPTWTTELQLGDGEIGISQGECDRDFPPGTTALAILTYALGCMGLALGPAPVPAPLAAYVLTRGWSAYGPASQVVQSLLAGVAPDLSQLPVLAQAAVGLYQLGQSLAGHQPLAQPVEIYVDDGLAYIVQRSQPLALPPIRLSSLAEPGAVQMIDRPERLDGTGLRLRCLLAPAIRLGQPVIVSSREVLGTYRVQSLVHAGDNRGGETTTQIDVLPVAV